MLNAKDIVQLENILRALRKAKFDDMQGLEVLALASAYHWLENFVKVEKMESLAPPPVSPPPPSVVEEKKSKGKKK